MTIGIELEIGQPGVEPVADILVNLEGQSYPSIPIEFFVNDPASAFEALPEEERRKTNEIVRVYFDSIELAVVSLSISNRYGQTSSYRVTASGDTSDLANAVTATHVRITIGAEYSDGSGKAITLLSANVESSSFSLSAADSTLTVSGSTQPVKPRILPTFTVAATNNNNIVDSGNGGRLEIIGFVRPFFSAKTIHAPDKIREISENDGEIERISCPIKASVGIGDRLIFSDGRAMVAGAIEHNFSPSERTTTISKLALDAAYNNGTGTEYFIGNEVYQRVPWVRGVSGPVDREETEYL